MEKEACFSGGEAPRLLHGALCVVPFTSTSPRKCMHHSKCNFHQVLRSRLPALRQRAARARAAAGHF
jgi:hypothetical protein